MKRILIVRLDEIGDFILTVPMLRELKQNYPGVCIDIIVKHQLVSFVRENPYIDNVTGAEVTRRKFYRNLWLVVQLLWNRLKKGRYDLAILPRPSPDRSCSRILAWIAGAIKIMAYDTSCVGPDKKVPNCILTSIAEHNVLSNLRFVTEAKGIIHSDKITAQDLVRKIPRNIDFWKGTIKWDKKKKYALCAIRSVSEKRNWEKEKFLTLIEKIYQEIGYISILLGDGEDAKDAEWIAANCTENCCISLCGKTTLPDLISIMSIGDFYFGTDTSIVHFASACNIPCIVLSPHAKGYNSWLSAEVRFRPWQVPCRIVNPPEMIFPCINECLEPEAHCIKNITPEIMFAAIDNLLQKELVHATSEHEL